MEKRKIENLNLFDPFPSSISGYMTIRESLWNLIQKIEMNEELRDQDHDDGDRDIKLGDNYGLPLTFQSKKRICSLKKKKKKQNVLKALAFSESRSEQNIFMGYSSTDGLYYPCRVVGNGSTHRQNHLETSVIYFLGYGTYAEVYRSQLLPIPLDRLDEVQQLVYHDTLMKTQGGIETTQRTKYYDQRYRLFSRFDQGIILDEESWFSVTPEIIAKEIAKNCQKSAELHQVSIGTVLDCFCGVGGNGIAMSKICKFLIAGDIDRQKLEMFRSNAKIYSDDPSHCNIEYLEMDAYDLIHSLSTFSKDRQVIDIAVLAPPWGGIDYHFDSFDLKTMITSGNGIELVQKVSQITSSIIFIIPKNTKLKQLYEISSLTHLPMRIQRVSLHEKLKMLVVYYGEFFQRF